MKRKRSILSKKIMAVALSVAMMMTSIQVTATEYETKQTVTAQMLEEETEETVESSVEENTVEESEEIELTQEETSEEEAETEEITTETETETEEITTEEETEMNQGISLYSEAVLFDVIPSVDGKIDAWDFGAEQLDPEKYTNKLTADIINSWYPDVEAGSTGKNIASFAVKDADGNTEFAFNDGGFPATHRLRTTNTALTRYDAKSLSNVAGTTTYNGYIYSNKSATDAVNVQIALKAGDIVTVAAASNGGNSDIFFKYPSGESQKYEYTLAGKIGEHTFYAPETGLYTIYSATEKLVLARILVEHTQEVNVVGYVNAPKTLTDDYSVVFACQETKAVTKVAVNNGTYQTVLREGYTYDVALENANGYVITSDKTLTLEKNAGGEDHYQQFDIEVSSVKLHTITGEVKGLSKEALSKLVLELTSEEIFVPTIKPEGEKYSVQVESGVEYEVSYSGIDDYELTSDKTVTFTKDQTFDFVFDKKATHKVTINPVGATTKDLENAEFIFTRHDDEEQTVESNYVYKFTGTEDIELRDGIYTVKVENAGAFVQKMTSNLVVKGNDVTKTIEFLSEITAWDFADPSFTGAGFTDTTKKYSYNGLVFEGGKSHNGTYLYMGSGKISVPVKGDCKITVSACYQYSFYFRNENEDSVNKNTGSTAQIDTFTLTYQGAAGYVDITTLGTSYITKIEIVNTTDYASVVSVGAKDCDYTTINDALAAVKKMDRPNNERVTIEIQPGDYEEMLVIDVPNVTLKNASNKPSIETTNKGVDIADNAVRITSYYGHGYTYYSMNNNCKYDEDLLAVNKANGYPSFVNPGSGTTNESYWNATVTIAADGFEADGIIFENSFNQYVSKKAANDIIVKQSGAKEGSVARSGMQAGDTTVQDKKYVERAAALAIKNNCKQVSFDNCKFIGRQDTLYGGTGVTAAFYDCAIYGGTDYIFGGMTAVFAKCALVFNTMEDKNDVGYITAAQQKEGRGYLMYNCDVVSTTPGVDTASTEVSKAGYLGRPWQATTSEVVFYATNIGAANDGSSLIVPVGWNDSLSGKSDNVYEIGTAEMVKGVDNSSKRVSWAKTIADTKDAKLADGSEVSVQTFLGDWDAFAGKDMTITTKAGTIDAPKKDDEQTTKETVFTLESKDLAAFAAKSKADGEEEKAGTDNYFTIIYSTKSKVDISNKEFADGYTSGQRINLGGVASTAKNAIKFTTDNKATVKIWWAQGGDDNRQMAILDAEGSQVAVTSVAIKKNDSCVSTLELAEAGTYYLGGVTGNNYIFKVEVTETPSGVVKPPRADWSTVAEATIQEIAIDQTNANNVNVTVQANIGYDGADEAVVAMFDKDGKEVATKKTSKETAPQTVSFTPQASGIYTFQVRIVRSGEEDKVTAEKKEFAFTLPLAQPVIKTATSIGGGSVEVEWNEVKEAESYVVTAEKSILLVFKSTDVIKTNDLSCVLKGLEIGKEYSITVKAIRGEDESIASEAVKVLVTEDAQRVWGFSAYGSSTDTKHNGYEGSIEKDKLTVYSEDGKGKIVPGSTDGLAYYYAKMNPETENFTLKAKVHVDNWTLSNGQEGFGLMVSDTVGPNGNGTAFWNNGYQAIASKVEYYYDGEKITTDTTASKITMKCGLGVIAKSGVTAQDVADIKAGAITMPAGFTTETVTLETSCAAKGAGTYNIIGNFKGAEPTGNQGENDITDFVLSIQRNNTGYIIRYYDVEGNLLGEKLYYDLERTALTQIEEDAIYVGFFASRNARMTVTDIELTTINPEDDAPAQDRVIEEVIPNYAITSATVSNTAEYDLVFRGNADGTLVIVDQNNKEITNQHVDANKDITVATKLVFGKNPFKATFTPDQDYIPGEYKVMANYDAKTIDHEVIYTNYGKAGDSLYVSVKGAEAGNGTKEKPLDIYTAVKYVQPGQTIVVMEGTYNLTKTVKVERGIDGTAEQMIYMIADPEAASRPVFDFGGKCAGMILAGDYWYFKGFDVTKSADGQKGIQVSGNNNTLDQINAYMNGNTGIQISRYLGTDEFAKWPANNLILNCTSYLNADKGYEDADGFAAKLTVGNGNVFDGCIAHHNADDGWDLFAKVQSGSIGKVVIKNSVAYKNGYVLTVDGKRYSALAFDGKETDAGNGNGFKMGGDSMSGYHEVRNSIAFENKAKGIDSNSCPDIQAYDCVSFDNESYNVAMYTNTAVNTDYAASGVISYKKKNTTVGEQFKFLGSQVETKVKNSENFFFDGTKSVNTEGVEVQDDWFESLTFTGIDRNADGTINTHGFLVLTDKAKTGNSIGGRPSTEVIPGGETDGSSAGKEVEDVIITPVITPSQGSEASNSEASESTTAVIATNPTTRVAAKSSNMKTIFDENPALAASMDMVSHIAVEAIKEGENTLLKLAALAKYFADETLPLSTVIDVYTGTDVGFSFMNTDEFMAAAARELVIGADYKKVLLPGNAIYFAAESYQNVGIDFMMHMSLGQEYAGKTVVVYMRNSAAEEFKFDKKDVVNQIGNVGIFTKEINNILVIVLD